MISADELLTEDTSRSTKSSDGTFFEESRTFQSYKTETKSAVPPDKIFNSELGVFSIFNSKKAKDILKTDLFTDKDINSTTSNLTNDDYDENKKHINNVNKDNLISQFSHKKISKLKRSPLEKDYGKNSEVKFRHSKRTLLDSRNYNENSFRRKRSKRKKKKPNEQEVATGSSVDSFQTVKIHADHFKDNIDDRLESNIYLDAKDNIKDKNFLKQKLDSVSYSTESENMMDKVSKHQKLDPESSHLTERETNLEGVDSNPRKIDPDFTKMKADRGGHRSTLVPVIGIFGQPVNMTRYKEFWEELRIKKML